MARGTHTRLYSQVMRPDSFALAAPTTLPHRGQTARQAADLRHRQGRRRQVDRRRRLGVLGARHGLRTMVAELSSQQRVQGLFDRYGEQFEEVQLAPRLFTISIDPEHAMDEYLRVKVGALGHALAGSRLFQTFAMATPGMRELLTIGKVWELAQLHRRTRGASPYDLVIVDAPATGHGLGLLRTPRTFADIARVGPIAHQGRDDRPDAGRPGLHRRGRRGHARRRCRSTRRSTLCETRRARAARPRHGGPERPLPGALRPRRGRPAGRRARAQPLAALALGAPGRAGRARAGGEPARAAGAAEGGRERAAGRAPLCVRRASRARGRWSAWPTRSSRRSGGDADEHRRAPGRASGSASARARAAWARPRPRRRSRSGMAAQGAKVAVVTIDPAQRLANALGVEELPNEPHRVEPEPARRGRPRGRGRAVGDDARPQADVRRADRPDRAGSRSGPRRSRPTGSTASSRAPSRARRSSPPWPSSTTSTRSTSSTSSCSTPRPRATRSISSRRRSG